MNFNDVLVAVRDSAGQNLDIPQNWGQGRATFGGLVAAVMLQRIQIELGIQRPLRSLSLSFVAPVAPGTLQVQVRLLREGKAATQVQATALQQEQVCAVMLASFGSDRESVVQVEHPDAPTFTAPDQVQAFPFIPGLTPDFTQYFDYRYTLGKMPFMGGQQTEMGGWIRLCEASPAMICPSTLLALMDALAAGGVQLVEEARKRQLIDLDPEPSAGAAELQWQ
ncbi:thioesterase family protein [Pseudomonas anguilliseptica]|uniref:thioesterase family protein n=1 Tax=Pseudomonas anguilliseptica TaxID=53406 RepID=UPI000B218526|nr:thioesterase family protein [Pseudomonas anguilliseptica]